MIPVTFGDCFGWLHEGKGKTGVVLCGSFGQEGMIAYSGWRALADRLARAGLHVLRFDYPGVGDSLGSEIDPHRLATWTASIRNASEFLCASTGVDRVVLIGLRLGGALALRASANMAHVVAVACVVPVVSGRTYVRELRLMTSAWRDANLLPAATALDGCLEVVGDRLTETTVRELSGLDLRTVNAAASHILFLEDDAYPSTVDLAAHLSGLGCTVTRSDFLGAAEYLQDALTNRFPHESFDKLVRWCHQFHSSDSDHSNASGVDAFLAHLATPSGSEEPFRFGSFDEFFGILSTPRYRRANVPTVVMVNTGFGRRVGDGRVYVALARRLAAIGVPSLRMDLAGFGDSAPPTDGKCDPYSSSHASGVSAACDALEQRGLFNPYLIGICSGAYAAFHATVADPRVQGAVVVNLQKFIWNEASSLKIENRRSRRPVGFYLRSVVERKAWRRLFQGKVEVVSIVVSLLRRPWTAVCREVCLRIETATGMRTKAGRIVREVRSLDERGARVDLVYSDGDPGLSELAQHFGSKFRRLRAMSNIHIEILDAADHALLDYNARSQFIELVVSRLQRDDGANNAQMAGSTDRVRAEPASVSS